MSTKKRRKYYKLLSFIISLIMITVSIPSTVIFAIEAAITSNEIITETPITPEPIDSPEDNGGSGEESDPTVLEPVLPQLQDIEDGVYAIKNVGNSTSSYSLYMDIYGSYWYSGVSMQQYRLEGAATPCDTFTRSALFKITKVDGSYVIRSMRNNLLSFKMQQKSDGTYGYFTAEIPLDDSVLPDSDKFVITETAEGSGQYLIQQHGTYKYITAPNSTTAGNLSTGTTVTSRAKWEFIKYTGADSSDVFFTNAGSMVTGEQTEIYPVFYSTRPGYNILSLDIQSPISSWYNLDSTSAYGKFKIKPYMNVDIVADVKISNGTDSYVGGTLAWKVSLPFEEGAYFFKNVRDTNKYIQINNTSNMHLEGEIIELHNFHGYYEQRWEVIHQWNGYYRIESQYSDLVLTAPTGPNNDIVTQTSYASQDTQVWKFIEQSDGTYKISPKSNTNLYMSAGDISSTADQDLEIRTAQSDGGDKWYSLKIDGTEAMFLGITDAGHDHHTVFGDIAGEIISLGYEDFNYIAEASVPLSTVQNGISNAKIYVSRSHGGEDSNGTYIYLGGQYLGTSQIYDYSTNTAVINLSNCDLMLFVACKTATHPTRSLPDAAVDAGAQAAIGFEESIGCSTANDWVRYFFDYYLQGYSVGESASKAAYDCDYANNIGSFRRGQ